MYHFFKAQVGLLLLLSVLTQCTPLTEPTKEIETLPPKELPYQVIPLTTLDSFQMATTDWQIIGQVVADFENEGWQTSSGEGVLANQQTQGGSDLFTSFTHGDMELDIEFLVPKGSNSGIYFQSRYELQILDSWQIEDPSSSDCGGIYERWNENNPKGEEGYEGHAPSQNAALAPGLWQKFHVKFRAPRFDQSGEKISNARFEEVTLNGIKIHENVELSGPTRGATENNEVALAPLRFQGDHGKVAFRNFRYKLYGSDTLKTSNVSYQYFEIDPPISQLPNFDSLEMVTSGSSEVMDVNLLSKRGDGVVFRFRGDLEVKRAGDYLFHLYSDDGSQLFIDDVLIIDHNGTHDLEPKRGLVTLKKGTHTLQIDYFNNVWGKGMMLLYEGPEQELQTLQGLYPYSTNYVKTPLMITPEEQPELIRSFFEHDGDKRTHAVSIGDPAGVHYAYDLKSGSLLSPWRGNFADVTDMWQGRGHSQLLVPAEVELVMPLNELVSQGISYWGYQLQHDGRPVFIYEMGDTRVYDTYMPDENGLKRKLWTEGLNQELTIRVGAGQYVGKVNDQYFCIDGAFYLKNQGTVDQEALEGGPPLAFNYMLNSDSDTVEYSMIW